MIDTLVLRIHGIEKYNHYKTFIKQQQNDFTKKFNYSDSETLDKTAIMYSDTGKILDVTLRSTLHINSSHYDISCSINDQRDYIEINFSIPKYTHSTNVLQFIDSYDLSPEHVFDKMLNCISNLFSTYFPTSPDWSDVEINRIDICYNQIFESKEDSLRYLDNQRNINVAFARSDKNRFPTFGNSTVQYTTDNYSFKIYHKGTEFRKGDYLKLCKNNPKGLKLDHLRDTADKILRYEITCRKGLLNYVFKQRLLEDENSMFFHHYEKIGKMRTKETKLFIEKTVPGKSFGFHLDSAWNKFDSLPHQLIDDFNLPFTRELFCELHSFFWERVEKYQLGVKMGMSDIYTKIKDFQKNRKTHKEVTFEDETHVAHAGQLLLIAALSQYTDISDLKKVLPKSTYYRYCKQLKELGIPKHCPDIAIAPPALDYSQYFFEFGNYHTTYH